jgi:predicted transcriptional regulator
MSTTDATLDLLRLAADIVTAHVSHNEVAAGALPLLIRNVYASLHGAITEPAVETRRQPVVAVNQSVFPDYIVCLEDGKKMRALKRHLQSAHGLTTEAYRKKWVLPPDYPMIAPNYAKIRAGIARKRHTRQPANPAPGDVPVRRFSEGARGKKQKPP